MARKNIDWDLVEREYRTNTYSDAELSRRHGCSRTAIQKRAEKGNWKRDLRTAVSQATAAKLLQEDAKVAAKVAEVAGCNAGGEEGCNQLGSQLDDSATVDMASDTRAEVVKTHRKDINRLRAIEAKILEELGGNPTKLYITQYQGGIVEKEVGIPVTDRAAALNNLANVQHKRIQLERQAFNIDDAPPEQSSIDEVLSVVAQRRRPLVVESDDPQD